MLKQRRDTISSAKSNVSKMLSHILKSNRVALPHLYNKNKTLLDSRKNSKKRRELSAKDSDDVVLEESQSYFSGTGSLMGPTIEAGDFAPTMTATVSPSQSVTLDTHALQSLVVPNANLTPGPPSRRLSSRRS